MPPSPVTSRLGCKHAGSAAQAVPRMRQSGWLCKHHSWQARGSQQGMLHAACRTLYLASLSARPGQPCCSGVGV